MKLSEFTEKLKQKIKLKNQNNFYQKIFSVKNQLSKNNKWYKVIYFLGIKFSFRNKRKEKRIANEREKQLIKESLNNLAKQNNESNTQIPAQKTNTVQFGDLNLIGIKHNTDKASQFNDQKRIYKGHDYLKYYELFLSTLINKNFTLVELGVKKGASLRMWKEYYQKANIVGVDISKECLSLQEDRISIICSNAISNELPKKLSKYNNIMCIIDDCSHAWGEQRRAFEKLFPILNSGGYYIIEDLECGTLGAYPEITPQIIDSQPFWDYAMDRIKILRVSKNRNPVDFRPFFNQLPENIQMIEKSIDMSIVLPGAIIFRKRSIDA